MNEMIEAIRADKLIGKNTCSTVDECYSESDLADELRSMDITTPLEAVKWARELEGLQMDRMMDQRWGEDSDSEVKIKKDWDERLAANPIT